MTETVLVTGASGFSAPMFILHLLNRTSLNVLIACCKQSQRTSDPWHLSRRSLSDNPAAGVAYIIHVASLFHYNFEEPVTEMEIMQSSVNGTLSILKSAHEFGALVKWVVIKSYFATIGDRYGRAAVPLRPISAKTSGEHAARKFMAETTPSILVNGGLVGVPDTGVAAQIFTFVDVRDLAVVQVLTAFCQSNQNERPNRSNSSHDKLHSHAGKQPVPDWLDSRLEAPERCYRLDA
ncbi:hypothetical protein V1504DRAFT_499783 [Lipomyces starkeyi]